MDGVILVNKEKNMTSHDVVNQMRRILHTRKVGHSGTLDPNVVGVLAIFVNKGCKSIQFMEDKSKQYKGVMALGSSTSTEDSDGVVIATDEVSLPLDEQKLRAIFTSMIGKRQQVPPMVSAVKINGKKLYEYAREGIEIERPSREIEITRFELLSIQDNLIEFVVDCSSGTYVRTLCVDVGVAYGTLAHMHWLQRTRVGEFHLKDCVTLDEIRAGNLHVIPVKDALKGYPSIAYQPIADIKNGKKVQLDQTEPLVLMVEEETAIAMYQREENGWYSCVRGLW